jgi:hypothetical protein
MQSKLTGFQLPKLRRAVDENTTFKLTVRLLSASIPGLAGADRLLSRERPRIEVVLGNARKETELGVHRGRGAAADDLPWSFDESLTFTASMADILGPGLQVWLRTDSNWQLGPLQLNFATSADIGVASLDLRGKVLPELLRQEPLGAASEVRSWWEAPVMTLPLTCVSVNNARPDMCALGEAAGHVALVCGISMDPQLLSEAVDVATMPLLDRVAGPVAENIAWVQENIAIGSQPLLEWVQDQKTDPQGFVKLVSQASGEFKQVVKDSKWAHAVDRELLQAELATRELFDRMHEPVSSFLAQLPLAAAVRGNCGGGDSPTSCSSSSCSSSCSSPKRFY